MLKINNEKNNPKYQRINDIYNILVNNSHGLSIGELAKLLDVSTKTIQRDLYEVLSEFGAIKEGRLWKINPKNTNDNLGANERLILGILDEMAKNAGSIFYSKAHNLLSQVTQQLEHPIFSGINSETLDDKNIKLFGEIEQSIKSKNEITFEYEHNHIFQVKPLKLVFFDGFWYLLCFDSKDKNIFKKFHLKTIKKVSTLKKQFEVKENIESKLRSANSIWFNLDEDINVRLLLSKEIRKYFERKPLPSQNYIGEDKDGSLEIEVKITHEMEIVPLIMYYIPHIKVLEPDWLGKIIKDRVNEYISEIKDSYE